MLSLFSRWGRPAAYTVVIVGLFVWLLTTDGSDRGAGLSATPLVILGAAVAAYVAGAAAELRRKTYRRKKLLRESDREV